MRMRFAAVLLAVLPLVAPAHADDAEKGIKIGGGFAGTIAASTSLSDIIEHGRVATLSVAGICAFDAVVLPNNRVTVAFGGSAVSAGLAVPELTYVKCDVSNRYGGYAESGWADGGPMSRTAGTAGPWLVQEIDICITAFAIFGPSPARTVSIPRTCNSFI